MVAARMIDLPSRFWGKPFAELGQVARQMDLLTNSMFGRQRMPLFSAKVFPAVNITEDKDKYYVRAELPGIKADGINLEVTGKKLVISGERKIPSEGEKARYHRREREAGRFSRAISLPSQVDADSVDAKMANGLLTVAIAKSEASKPKKITIQ